MGRVAHVCAHVSRPVEFILVLLFVVLLFCIHSASFCWPSNSSVVNIALGPGDSQSKTVLPRRNLWLAICGRESRVQRISAWCTKHHNKDTGEGKEMEEGKEAEDRQDKKAARNAKAKLRTRRAHRVGQL